MPKRNKKPVAGKLFVVVVVVVAVVVVVSQRQRQQAKPNHEIS